MRHVRRESAEKIECGAMDAAILLERALLWVEEFQRWTIQPSLTHWLVVPWLACA